MARILVIEDNPENLELMTYLLGAFGHSILTACKGERGIALACAERPDLGLCDVHLPDVDGYAVVRRLKQDPALRPIPVLAVSALATADDHARGLAAGFDGYLAKPIDPPTFVTAIERFLPTSVRGSAPTAAGIVATGTSSAPKFGPKLLVVDDVSLNRELLRQLLEPIGYTVERVASAAAAMARIEQEAFDLVLTDLCMPEADGIDLLRCLKSDPRTAKIPVILLTSSSWSEAQRAEALALGVARFLPRPIEPAVLLDEIAACLRLAKEATHGDDPDR